MTNRDPETETLGFLLFALRALREGHASKRDFSTCLNLANRCCPRAAQTFRAMAADALHAAGQTC